MSIMNGYGQALVDKVTVMDIAPLFLLGYASFTKDPSQFGRFRNGAGYWVQTMFAQARSHFGTKLAFNDRCRVIGVIPQEGGPVRVQWLTKPNWNKGSDLAVEKQFDYVVSTVDMNTNSRMLDIPDNHASGMWNWYRPYVGVVSQKDGADFNDVWPLEPGYCYLHTDATMFPTGTPTPAEEVLQFTAYWSPPGANSTKPYDIVWTWTTYIERNLLGGKAGTDPDFDYFLTMYGFNPNGKKNADGSPIKVPADSSIVKQMSWTHGMWLPSFMMSQKEQFGTVQGVSPTNHNPIVVSPRRRSNVFFAGNNLTMDSEEGAFGSAMALAKYMFDIDAPRCIAGAGGFEQEFGVAEYLFFYELMFDMADDGQGAYRRLLRHLLNLKHLAE